MADPTELAAILGSKWPLVLEHVGAAVIVLDRERTIRFANGRARELLGYRVGEPIGGRCRLTTRGLDCGESCPLTFALERGLEVVDGFTAVYHTREGQRVPLSVTVIPLRDGEGELTGSIELLHSTEPDPGFFMAGSSGAAVELRRRTTQLALSGRPLALVGERPACADVARAVHRFAGLADELFLCRSTISHEVPRWPPGTLYEDVEDVHSDTPPGWRVIERLGDGTTAALEVPVAADVLELPTVDERRSDLPLMISAWVERTAPGVKVTPEALQRLCRMAVEVGLEGVEGVLMAAVAAADTLIECSHLPSDCFGTALLDELLAEQDPLAALEKRLLREVLERSGWRMQDAADRLGISRVTLWRKLKEYGISRG